MCNQIPNNKSFKNPLVCKIKIKQDYRKYIYECMGQAYLSTKLISLDSQLFRHLCLDIIGKPI